MSCIKSLDQSTVHRICSGQVIINIANAVKELIENSLDAGAKTIEIRLKNYGSDCIDVIDDGPGIDEADFQTITLKHYTSKIQKYDDLESLGTFGFRGEALSSLCALSNLSIVTRHTKTQMGTRLIYDKSGLIIKKENIARPIGTTVTLEKIFHTLPVRHKEFLRNLKKEFNKLIHVIQTYCLISEGVRMSCTHFVTEKNITKLMCTQSKNSLKDNIIEIFGLASFKNMIPFEQVEPNEDILIEYKIITKPSDSKSSNENSATCSTNSFMDADEDKENTNHDESIQKKKKLYSDLFKIEGFISNVSHGLGRSAPDRQYIYVNKRPCDNSRITKLINEIFHQFNRNQYPMFVLNVILDTHDVDVNVTPDKLQMFFKNESVLLAIMKASLQNLYSRLLENISLNESSFHCQNSTMLEFFTSSKTPNNGKNTPSRLSSKVAEDDIEEIAIKKNVTIEKENYKVQKRQRDDEDQQNPDFTVIEETVSLKNTPLKQLAKQPKLDEYINSPLGLKKDKISHKSPPNSYIGQKEAHVNRDSLTENNTHKELNTGQFTLDEKLNLFENRIGSSKPHCLDDSVAERIDLHMCNRVTTPIAKNRQKTVHENLKSLGLTQTQTDHDLNLYDSSFVEKNNETFDLSESSCKNQAEKNSKQSESINEVPPSTELTQENISNKKSSSKTENEIVSEVNETINGTMSSTCSTQEYIEKRKEKIIKFNWNRIKQNHLEMIEKNVADMDKTRKEDEEKNLIKNLKFKSKNIESKDAENELDRCITKEDFLKMKVIGQFNKGFILSQLDNELFIVDQHAADEIYNFELLQRDGKMDKQRLLQPRYLELTASAEASLCDNLNLLEKAGYDLEVCSNRKVGNRIMITAVPMSKQSNKLFDFKDIDELLFILNESDLNSGSISASSSEQSNLTEIKSSSLRAMYASKACRKSIMIGTSLNISEMKRVINHLYEIEKPWNCPHGRPTMRHLINIDLLRRKNFN